jgi:hypothetical protein
MNFWRQKGILPPENLNFPVVIVGVGGIGSPTALCLSKMGVSNLTIYDHDSVEEHNVPTQLYFTRPIGVNKAEALSDIIHSFTGYSPIAKAIKFDGILPLGAVVISGVDSMAARREIWDMLKDRFESPLYIEARMAAEVGIINTVRLFSSSEDKEWYEKECLCEDEEAIHAACTERSIFYNTLGIASIIGKQIQRYASSIPFEREIIMDLFNLEIHKGAG